MENSMIRHELSLAKEQMNKNQEFNRRIEEFTQKQNHQIEQILTTNKDNISSLKEKIAKMFTG